MHTFNQGEEALKCSGKEHHAQIWPHWKRCAEGEGVGDLFFLFFTNSSSFILLRKFMWRIDTPSIINSLPACSSVCRRPKLIKSTRFGFNLRDAPFALSEPLHYFTLARLSKQVWTLRSVHLSEEQETLQLTFVYEEQIEGGLSKNSFSYYEDVDCSCACRPRGWSLGPKL